MWGDFGAPASTKRAEDAESGWQAILESRKRAFGEVGPPTEAPGASFWGDWEEVSPKRLRSSVVFQLGVDAAGCRNQDLEIRNAQLSSRLPALASLMTEGSDSTTQVVDFKAVGVSRGALLSAVEFAVAGPGANEQSENLWIPKQTRAISKASTNSEVVERALHALEILRCAAVLGLPRLQEEADTRLWGSELSSEVPLLCEASAMPLLASSFTHEKRISQRCMQLLLQSGPDLLRGRERQLGVIYATQPVVGCLLSGLFKAVSKPPKVRIDLNPLLEDLLLGPKSGRAEQNRLSPEALGYLETSDSQVALKVTKETDANKQETCLKALVL